MANVDTFPLLKLPYLPLANVIQQFDSIRKRVYLATLSRRTAILVKSLRNIKVLGLKLRVSSILILSVIQLTDGRIQEPGWIYGANPNTQDFPFLVDYNYLQKLIDTMFFIFGFSGFEELVFEEGTMEMSRLQNLLRNLNTIKFDKIYFSEFYEQALAAFPSARNVSMKGKPKNQLLTKELDILEFSSRSLGIVNCESLQISVYILNWKELNQFMKSWIQGRMPRLKHVRIRNRPPLRKDWILEGIVNAEADRNRKMTFRSYSLNLGAPKTTVVQGGVDIKSENGARATVTIQNEGTEFQSWNMYVWD